MPPNTSASSAAKQGNVLMQFNQEQLKMEKSDLGKFRDRFQLCSLRFKEKYFMCLNDCLSTVYCFPSSEFHAS